MIRLKIIILVIVFSALLLGTFAGGAFFGYSQRPAVEKAISLYNKEAVKPAQVDFSPFWVAWNEINIKYVSKEKLDDQKRVWGAIQGMVQAIGDPYTVFFPPQESKMFQQDISGGFEGVGMEIGVRNGVITVIAPLKDTPAYKAGIKAGDKIIKVDDRATTGMSSDQAASFIRGPKDTKVRLTIIRESNDQPLEIEIIRNVIKIPVLDTEKRPDGIFVIKLYNFSGNSTNIFREALREFIISGSNKLLIDLRNNPGGYLESSVEMASWFLPAGKVVVSEKSYDGNETIYRSKGYDIFKDLPLVIIVNQGSASASEIFAAALKEHGKAKLVGEKTYGKGSVQELVQITPETSLKLTIAKWYTPNGNSIDEAGLEPDYKVELSEKDFEEGKDPQMEKAIEILKNL